VNREIEALGIKVVYQFATLSPYDFVSIIEAPNNEAVYLLPAEFGSRGTMKFLTMPAVTVDAFINWLKTGKM
jgi:uncharacterized protein with GYD domain